MLPVRPALFFHGFGKYSQGEKHLGLDVYLKVGNDTLAKLDHPYALAMEGPARNAYTRHRQGHSKVLGTQLPWIVITKLMMCLLLPVTKSQ